MWVADLDQDRLTGRSPTADVSGGESMPVQARSAMPPMVWAMKQWSITLTALERLCSSDWGTVATSHTSRGHFPARAFLVALLGIWFCRSGAAAADALGVALALVAAIEVSSTGCK